MAVDRFDLVSARCWISNEGRLLPFRRIGFQADLHFAQIRGCSLLFRDGPALLLWALTGSADLQLGYSGYPSELS